MARSQKPIDVFVRLLLLLLSPLWFWLALEINGRSCRAWDAHAYRMGSHTHTYRSRAATKRLAKQKWEVMSHIWIFSPHLSGKGRGSPPISLTANCAFKTLVSGVKYQPGRIHWGQDGRLIFPTAKNLLLLYCQIQLLFLSVSKWPNGLEGGFDMVRYPCMLLPWAGSYPEAVCEAAMVPHFHWMWCLGYHATDSIIIFQ